MSADLRNFRMRWGNIRHQGRILVIFLRSIHVYN